jgi:cytidine deaminase
MSNSKGNYSQLRQLAKEAANKAHSPYSKVLVGASLVTEDGSLFSGCNIENASYGATVCAERVAIWQAVAQGHRLVKQLYVYSRDGWPPCGMCRQVMVEFGSEQMEIIFGDEVGVEQVVTLKDLMPHSFSAKQLASK